jgi:DNA polymerase III delta prime subunit
MQTGKMMVMMMFPHTATIQENEIRVPIGYKKSSLKSAVKKKLYWYPESNSPHILCAGQSGSAKTTWLKIFARMCVEEIKDSVLYIADPKRVSFKFAKGSPRLWLGNDSIEALRAFYQSMNLRINEDTASKSDYNWTILIFDELAAYTISQKDNKIVNELQSMLAATLMYGREVRHVVICAVQKALMEFFGKSGRSQFGTIVLLGDLTHDKEQIEMLMPQYKDIIFKTINKRGQFWTTSDGQGIRRGQFPKPETEADIRDIEEKIILGLSR